MACIIQNINIIIPKQVTSFVLPSYYIYNAIHLIIKGGYIMVWWAINYTNDNIATLLLMSLFYFNEDWFTIFTKIGQVWSFFETNMILNTNCHPSTSSINSMMAYDFVATQSIQITIIVVQPSFRQTYDRKIMIQHIQIDFKIDFSWHFWYWHCILTKHPLFHLVWVFHH